MGRERIDRRDFLKMAGIAAAAIGLAACAPASAPPPSPTKGAAAPPTAAGKASAPAPTAAASGTSDLYEAAKKEGQLMAYTVGTDQEFADLAKGFQQKYPGITATGFSGTSEVIRDKVFTEAKAGKPVADVIARDDFNKLYSYLQEGVLDVYKSPELKGLDPSYYDPKGYWALNSYFLDIIEYNTNDITKDQAPTSYQDLLKPEYKGKLGLEATNMAWFTYMLQMMGNDKGLAFMKGLAAQNPRLVNGHTSLHKLIVSGEIPIAAYMYHFRPLTDMKSGAPVQWVSPSDGTVGAANYCAVIKNASHPNAARLFEDFMLSKEGAAIIAKQGWIPMRTDIDLGDLAPVAKIKWYHSFDPSIGQAVDSSRTQFQQIFGLPTS